jgi:preprotein translocase subunit SecA
MARRLQVQHAAAQSVLASDEAAEAAPARPAGGGGVTPFGGGFGGGGVAPASGGPGPFAGGQHEQPVVREGRKVGRNEPCPCGSGKKYKHCHGQLAREA